MWKHRKKMLHEREEKKKLHKGGDPNPTYRTELSTPKSLEM